jgi:hypothetical protein
MNQAHAAMNLHGRQNDCRRKNLAEEFAKINHCCCGYRAASVKCRMIHNKQLRNRVHH